MFNISEGYVVTFLRGVYFGQPEHVRNMLVVRHIRDRSSIASADTVDVWKGAERVGA